VVEVFDHWRAAMGHMDAKLTPKRARLVAARLKEHYSVATLKRAIDGCRASAFHMGANDRGARYDDLTLICRDGEHVEQFLVADTSTALAPARAAPPSPREQRQKAGMVAMITGGLKGDGTMPGGSRA